MTAARSVGPPADASRVARDDARAAGTPADENRAKRQRRQPDGDIATRDVIIEAAIAAMFENGYHGTSVRQIADRAGMSVANVYYYFPSKQDLLFRFMDGSAANLLSQLDEMLAEAPPDPAQRLAAAVRLFVERHTVHQAAAFVAATELRALEPAARKVVVARRNAIEEVFRGIVADGVGRGAFRTDDVQLAVRAVLDMGSSVSSWYRADGPMTGPVIADRYVALALRMVGARSKGTGRRAKRPAGNDDTRE